MEIAREYDEYTAAYRRGGYSAAAPVAERILAKASRWWRRGDGHAHVLTAQMRQTIARAAIDRGDFQKAAVEVRLGLDAAMRAAKKGDPRWAFEGLMLMITRGEIETAETRYDDALETFDKAAQLDNDSDSPQWNEAQTHLLLARQWTLQSAGRYEESERAAEAALALASRHEPRLVPQALQRLSLIRRLTGASGDEQLAAAAAIQATQDAKPGDRADLAYQQASVALQSGDLEAAERHLAVAEAGYAELGDVRSMANAAVGYADIARQRGQTDEAIAASRRAAERADEVGDTGTIVEAFTVLGRTYEDAGRPEEALVAYDDAREYAEGDRMELIRLDVMRSVVAYNIGVKYNNINMGAGWGSGSAFGAAANPAPAEPRLGTPTCRNEAFSLAVSIAVPAAFAADAVRHELPPGEIRERWTREVSMRVADQALDSLMALGRTEEIIDLIEHVAASASLGLDEGSEYDDFMAFIGADEPLVSGDDGTVPPPRIRSFPDKDGPIWWAIDAAEELYGVWARSDDEVTAW